MNTLKAYWTAIKDKAAGAHYKRPLQTPPVTDFVEIPTISKYNGIVDDIQKDLEDTKQAASEILSSLVRSSEEERRRLELIFDSIGDAILLLDANGIITACNRTARQLLGLQSQVLIGQSLCERVPGMCLFGSIATLSTDYLEYMKNYSECVTCKTGCTHDCVPEELSNRYDRYVQTHDTKLNTAFRFEYCRPDGAELHLQLVLNVLTLNPNAQDFGFILVLRDLTHATQLEDNVLHLQSASSGLMSLLSVPVFYKDASCRFTSVNRPFRELLDLSEDDVIGKTVFEIFEKACAEQLVDLDNSAINSDETQRVTVDLHTLKGLVRTANVISRAIKTGKRVTGLTGSVVSTDPMDEYARGSIFAAAAKSVIFVNALCTVVGCNDEFLRLCELQKSEVIGKSIEATELKGLLGHCDLLVSDTIKFKNLEYGRMRLPVVEATGEATSSVFILFQHI